MLQPKPGCRVDGSQLNGETHSTLGMTTANKITILRILAVPFFIVQVLYYIDTGGETYRWLAFVSFVLAAICDGVDGYIARRYNQRSELGAILDPLADKLLLASAVVLLSLDNEQRLARIPLWLTATIIGRDVIVALGIGVVHYINGKVIVRPLDASYLLILAADDGRLEVSLVAERLRMPVVHDEEHGLWALGPAAGGHD